MTHDNAGPDVTESAATVLTNQTKFYNPVSSFNVSNLNVRIYLNKFTVHESIYQPNCPCNDIVETL